MTPFGAGKAVMARRKCFLGCGERMGGMPQILRGFEYTVVKILR
jgi:hypothetical protein